VTYTSGVPAPSVPAVAARYSERLLELFGERLASVRIFGSYARGTADDDSDVDVVVLVRALTRREKIHAIELGCEVATGTGIALSPFVLSEAEFEMLVRLESRLALDIEREGLPL
jgi:predicted nucleotidyltransferase